MERGKFDKYLYVLHRKAREYFNLSLFKRISIMLKAFRYFL